MNLRKGSELKGKESDDLPNELIKKIKKHKRTKNDGKNTKLCDSRSGLRVWLSPVC